MKTRKRKKKKKKKKKPSRRKTREFSGDRRVSRNPRETTATARPPSAQHLQNTCKGRKERKFREREREISDRRRRVSSFSDEPSNHP